MTQTRHVYFGGSFDPPHLGHDDMLRALAADSLAHVIHLVPTAVNPLKSRDNGARALWGDPQFKRASCAAWLESLRQRLPPSQFQKIKLETIELDRVGEPSFSVDTIESLRQRDGGVWSMAVGSDILGTLARWKDMDTLLAGLHSLWVFAREGRQLESDIASMGADLRARIDLRIMPDAVTDVSSTEVRARLESPNALHELSRLALLPELRQLIAGSLIK